MGISQLKKLSRNVIKSQINPERTSYAKQGAEQRGGMSSLHTHVDVNWDLNGGRPPFVSPHRRLSLYLDKLCKWVIWSLIFHSF